MFTVEKKQTFKIKLTHASKPNPDVASETQQHLSEGALINQLNPLRATLHDAGEVKNELLNMPFCWPLPQATHIICINVWQAKWKHWEETF
jgi:hypothetical protein